MELKYDFLVIGSGIAGLSFALKVADHGSVCVLSKTRIEETNTRYAQGGIAAVTYEPDNFEKHIEDTLNAGSYINKREIVEMVVHEGPQQIEQLLQWGTRFDKTDSGEFELAKEGGHTEKRILHHKDNTGLEIQNSLVRNAHAHPNITILDHYFAIDLITQHHLGRIVTRYDEDTTCFGAYAINLKNQVLHTILAKTTLLATGGTGNLYQTTTNPEIATGDGVAMVYRAKGVVENMEFVQFHPTALYNPGENPSFLISEAVRGFGAVLRNQNGEAFMDKYDSRGSLAPRDIVARAIDTEMKIHGHDYVELDCRHLDQESLFNHFPNIYKKIKTLGINPAEDPIPVLFAAHYQCGGVKVNMHGESSIKNLYAVGEVASTGLHGGNRLASNSLLEAVVFADRAAKDAIARIGSVNYQENIPAWNDEGTTHPEEMILITQNYREMRQIMTNYVGIVRSDMRLHRALLRLGIIYRETEDLYKKSKISQTLCELRNLINIGYLVIKMALRRKESRGLHYNLDYPPGEGKTTN
ncbi:MAG: L-aspartate oxidase [Salinivirgaceae bacterium]|jgi:L-aspartate oxidase|nr:L-aspartate oxidase [Salinivirgaceae bacterium]